MSEEETRFFGLKRECGLHEDDGSESISKLLKQCSGKPACRNNVSIFSAIPNTLPACFNTVVLPAIMFAALYLIT